MAKILIVDDVLDNIRLLQLNLEDEEYEIFTAHNGFTCLSETFIHNPDVILLDMMMPGLSGLETLEVLKRDPKFKDIAVIMVSADDTDEAIIDAMDLGAHDYIAKPFIYPVLSARLRSALRLKESQEKLAEANANLSRLASTDSLTGAYNHGHFLDLFAMEFSKAKRHSRPFSVLMIDADHFKNINDSCGHAMGDLALKFLAKTCQSAGRESDFLGRLGGEEFAICCPDTGLAGAVTLAKRINNNIQAGLIESDGKSLQFTVSIGVSCITAEDPDFNSLLKRADDNLYQAKQAGRNQCISDQ